MRRASLDRLAAMQSTGPRESPVAVQARKRQEVALSGGFGTGAQQAAKAKKANLEGRQALFAEMKGPDAMGKSGEFRERARKLGVTDSGWKSGVARLEAAGSKPAMAGAKSWSMPPEPPVFKKFVPSEPGAVASNVKDTRVPLSDPATGKKIPFGVSLR